MLNKQNTERCQESSLTPGRPAQYPPQTDFLFCVFLFLRVFLDSIFGFLNFVSIMVKQLMHLTFSNRPSAG